ncbi:MAG: nucleotidyltransferase domain-containing protein [Gemmatimonadota bacterium]
MSTLVAELRGRLEELYGPRLERMVLFGSQARGDATPESDVDVLVVLHGDVRPGEEIERTGPLVSSLALEYGVSISRVFVSADRFRAEATLFLRNVLAEGVAV